ncbi:MAG: tetratricopeptide repeat protein [Treponemataceae bacterium]|nr:MAG: tetratricopeptide repeat protein [Treponemataceae bacterium]
MKKIKVFFKTQQERKQQRQTAIRITAVSCIFAAIAVCSFIFYQREKNKISINTARILWEQSDYPGVYRVTQVLLTKKPFNKAALAYRGFSAFYLSAAETDLNLAQSYLDEAIISMRKALYKADGRILAQLFYMLGKAYFYKNTISAYYYYADLAAEYLNRAKMEGFAAPDIPELLGLSYAALGMTGESIAAFSEALLKRDSDTLKLAIAEQYYNVSQEEAAEQHLLQAKQYLSLAKSYLSKVCEGADDVLALKSRFFLGSIYLDEGDTASARTEFQEIVNKDPLSPEGYYGMGLLYEKQGDYAGARAQWRKAQQYDPNHKGSRQKLDDTPNAR